MFRSLLPLAFLALFLAACSVPQADEGMEALLRNPLMAETIADRMLDYVTLLQIRASERKEPIQDPQILRTIDDTFLETRRILKEAHALQDTGKRGALRPVRDNYVKGEMLLLPDGRLFFGFDFDVDVAPGMRVLLAQHVAPGTEAELQSEPTRDLGPLKAILGAQEYGAGPLSEDEWNKYRTVVLYSPPLKSMIAYAQIRKKVTGEGM